MSKEVITDEERRRRRNEASRRCYLKRKALAAKAKPKARPVKAKPAAAKPAKPAKPSGKELAAASAKLAEKLVKKYAKVAAGVKPMVKEAAELLATVYKSGDQRAVEKTERILSKGLGVAVVDANEPKSKVRLEAVSKAVKSPGFRAARHAVSAAAPAEDGETEDGETEAPAEVLVDPELLAKIDAGEADKSEIDAQGADGDGLGEDPDEDLDDDSDEDPDGEDGDEDEDEDEDSGEDGSRSRRSDPSGGEDEYSRGRWEMLGEMGAQGAFDD